MKSSKNRRFGPSRRNEVVYSRTYVMYLVPLAAIFTAAGIAGAIYLAVGLVRADGEAIVIGALVTVFSLPLIGVAWINARSAVRASRIRKRQLRN